MGSGKTTVGRAIATQLGWSIRDSDAELRSTTGMTARELRESRGTAALHKAEVQALLRSLAQTDPSVICAAASVVDDPAARKELAGPGVAVIWLRASPAVLAARFASAAHRPVYGPDPEEVARSQAHKRDPHFAALHPITIDVDGCSEAEVIEVALEAVQRRLAKPG
jgi:shikimate kinase